MPNSPESLVLDLLSDDWFGLWEVDAWLASNAPQRDQCGRRSLVTALLRRRLVELRSGEDWAFIPTVQSIEGSKADDALAEPENWAWPDNRAQIYVLGLTSSGEALRAKIGNVAPLS